MCVCREGTEGRGGKEGCVCVGEEQRDMGGTEGYVCVGKGHGCV